MTRTPVSDPTKGRLMLPLVPLFLAEAPDLEKNGARYIIRAFAEAHDATRKSYRSLTREFVRKYFRSVDKAPNTRTKYAQWIRRFVEFGVEEGWFEASAALDWRLPNTSQKRSKEPMWLTADFLRELWESDNWYMRGALAALAMMVCRQSELITLKVGDVDMDARRINIIRHKTGDNDDRLPMMPELYEELSLYLAAYEDSIGQPLSPGMYLFPAWNNLFGRRIHVFPYEERGELSEIVKERIVARLHPEIAADPKKTLGLGAHTLRRSFARALYERLIAVFDNYDSMRVVQAMMGHTDITNTQKYIGMSSAREARDRAILDGEFSMFDKPAAPKARIYDGDNVIDLAAAIDLKRLEERVGPEKMQRAAVVPAEWWDTPEARAAGIDETTARMFMAMQAAMKQQAG